MAVYAARDHDRSTGPTFGLRLCGRCLRDRGGAWRYRWRIAGRELPERQDRAA